MPFKSKAQVRKCFAMKARGGTNWDCEKWAKHTDDVKSLPERAKEAVMARKKKKKVKY